MSCPVNFSGFSNATKSEYLHHLSERSAGYGLLLATTAVVGAVAFACFAFFSSVSLPAVGIFCGMEIINITALLYFANQADDLRIQSDAYDNDFRRKVAGYLGIGTLAFFTFVLIASLFEDIMKK